MRKLFIHHEALFDDRGVTRDTSEIIEFEGLLDSAMIEQIQEVIRKNLTATKVLIKFFYILEP
jgi:hypothetical protein